MPKYGFSPVPSHTSAPSGASASVSTPRHRRIGAARGRQRQPDPVAPHHLRPVARPAPPPPATSSRNRPLVPPTSTATSGRGRCASRGAQCSRRRGQPRRRHAVQRGAGDDDVRAGELVVPRRPRSGRSGAGRSAGAARSRCAPAAAAPPPPPPPCRRSRSRRSGSGGASVSGVTASSGAGQNIGEQMPPHAARAQQPPFGRQPGRLRQAERLRLQAGIVLGEQPGGGRFHGAGSSAARGAASIRGLRSRRVSTVRRAPEGGVMRALGRVHRQVGALARRLQPLAGPARSPRPSPD